MTNELSIRSQASAALDHMASSPRANWIAFALVLIFRDPRRLIMAQFWAEDGPVWYSDAYATGWRSLAEPHSGYLQTVSRLAALLAQPLPLTFAPTFFVLVALAIQALPSVILVSERMGHVWPNRSTRFLFALVILLLPNSQEVLANLTNSQWHLASSSFFLIVSSPPHARLAKAADLLIILLSGLSGPFCVVLLPLAIWQAREAQCRFAWGKAAVTTLSVCVQTICLVNTMRMTRSSAPLGRNMVTLARILATQVEAGALTGAHLMSVVTTSFVWKLQLTPILVALAGATITIVALRHGSVLLRKAAIMSGLLLTAALLAPQVSAITPQWDVLTRIGAGNRYFFIPMLAWVSMCFTLASDQKRRVRSVGRALLCLLPFGILGDLGWHKQPATDFSQRAAEFRNAPRGTVMHFAVLPTGFPPMTLIKKQ